MCTAPLFKKLEFLAKKISPYRLSFGLAGRVDQSNKPLAGCAPFDGKIFYVAKSRRRKKLAGGASDCSPWPLIIGGLRKVVHSVHEKRQTLQVFGLSFLFHVRHSLPTSPIARVRQLPHTAYSKRGVRRLACAKLFISQIVAGRRAAAGRINAARQQLPFRLRLHFRETYNFNE